VLSPFSESLPRPHRQLAGWHVLAGMVAFFGTVVCVNGAMIYSAISTYSGVVATEPYRKGLHYNDRVRADEIQQRMGWAYRLTIERDGQVEVAISATDAFPVRGLDVRLAIGRPTTNRHDVVVTLAPSPSGHYGARIDTLRPGLWIATIEARMSHAGSKPVFRARRRIWMAP
jgi:nitrogen fixation protein FixH